MSSSVPGPDFLCIGMQKAGTGWLHQALQTMDRFHPLPVKEFHHFTGPKDADRNGQRPHWLARKRRKGFSPETVDRLAPGVAEAFSQALDRYIAADRSDAAYLDLFASKGNKISGDITPSYSTLASPQIAEVRELLPHAKVLLSIRHPMDRAWSQFNMSQRLHLRREQHVTGEDQQAEIEHVTSPEELQKFLRRQLVLDRSLPSKIYRRWSRHFDNLILISFEDIVKNPARVYVRLSEDLLGVSIAERDVPAVENEKAASAKATKTPAHREILEATFRDEVEKCRKLFPLIAGSWG